MWNWICRRCLGRKNQWDVMYFLQTNFWNNKPCLNQVVPGTPKPTIFKWMDVWWFPTISRLQRKVWWTSSNWCCQPLEKNGWISGFQVEEMSIFKKYLRRTFRRPMHAGKSLGNHRQHHFDVNGASGATVVWDERGLVPWKLRDG